MAAIAAAGCLVVVALLALAVEVPPHLLDTRGLDTEKRLKAENDLRTTLVQALGGTVLLMGVYFTWRRLSAAERSNEIASEGQITEGRPLRRAAGRGPRSRWPAPTR